MRSNHIAWISPADADATARYSLHLARVAPIAADDLAGG